MTKIVRGFAVATFFAIVFAFGGIFATTSTTFAAENFLGPKNTTLLTADGILKILVGNSLVDIKWREYFAKGNDPMRGTITGIADKQWWVQRKVENR